MTLKHSQCICPSRIITDHTRWRRINNLFFYKKQSKKESISLILWNLGITEHQKTFKAKEHFHSQRKKRNFIQKNIWKYFQLPSHCRRSCKKLKMKKSMGRKFAVISATWINKRSSLNFKLLIRPNTPEISGFLQIMVTRNVGSARKLNLLMELILMSAWMIGIMENTVITNRKGLDLAMMKIWRLSQTMVWKVIFQKTKDRNCWKNMAILKNCWKKFWEKWKHTGKIAKKKTKIGAKTWNNLNLFYKMRIFS